MKVRALNKDVTGVDIYNAVRNELSDTFRDRIPEGNADNIKDVYKAMDNYEPAKNEFLNALVNRIGLVLINSKIWQNPLAKFRKELPLGDTVEEVFVNLIKGHEYNVDKAEAEVFKREKPDVQSIFHRVNFQQYYKTTVENDMLRRAFLDWSGVEDLISQIVSRLTASWNVDEYTCMRELLYTTCQSKEGVLVSTPVVNSELTAKALLTKIRAYSNKISFMQDKYNPASVDTYSDKADQILFISADADAVVDVNALAYAFNMGKADIEQMKIVIDEMPAGVSAMLVDKSYFMVLQQMLKTTELYNPQGLYWNYWLHVWECFSVSKYANCIIFADPAKIQKFEIKPATASIDHAVGGSVNFTTTVEYTPGIIFEDVVPVYSIKNPVDGVTVNADQGIVTIEANKLTAEATVTVVATSSLDSSITSEAVITLT